MSDSETISKLNTFITELEESEINQLNLDNKYEDFVKIVHTEMDLKLIKRKTNIYDGKSNKRRRMKKSWWNDNLTLLWNDVCKAERAWHKCHSGCKKDLRHIFVEKRKLFDKSSQKAKRQFWYNSQEQLLDDQKRDPREFWKKIGKVGVGNERQKSIPMEVTLDDGTTSTDTNTVLNKWKNCFDKLLNCNNQTIETNGNINISDDFLDREILFEEVEICKARGGQLASINSKAEDDAIIQHIESMNLPYSIAGYLIGAQDEISEGTFAWEDGTSLAYSNWGPGQPDNYVSAEDCVTLYRPLGLLSHYKWADVNCDVAVEFYICEAR
ncbi:unnamed protein product [Mytilus edulis]|uniref:C-type lectin domain-containing protein n=1 Tax=Mytilus edulis TaxID=6550 RepID=A0A8S3PVP5_MYTED|nr:unnamed protein product [Mytilus edulis]